jgi:HEXXH motif-containing protein
MLIRVPEKNMDPLLYFIEQLVHEASHIYLNGLMATDPIVLNSPEDRGISPLRTKLRPIISIFHATYVSARLFQSFLTLYLRTTDTKFLSPLTRTLNETIKGAREIQKKGILTTYGHYLLSSITELLELFETFSDGKFNNFTKLKMHHTTTPTKKSFLFRRIAT